MRNVIMESFFLVIGYFECMLYVMWKLSYEKEIEGKMERILDGVSF